MERTRVPVSSFPPDCLVFTSSILHLALPLCKARAATEPLHYAPVTPATQLGGNWDLMASAVLVPKQLGMDENCSCPACMPNGKHLPNLHQELSGHSTEPHLSLHISTSPTVAQFGADPAQHPIF